MERLYHFAGVDIHVHIPDPWAYTEERTLEPFRVTKAEAPYHFYYELVDSLSPPRGQQIASLDEYVVYADRETELRYIGAIRSDWEDAFIRTERLGKDCHVQLKSGGRVDRISVKVVLSSIAAEHLVAQAGGFVFHSSYVVWEDRAILFTAPSGTGKSTQAELWRSLRGAEIINGDRSVIRVTKEGILAEGLPFAGSSQICKKRALPLAAIVYLSQAPQTAIRPLRGAEAFRRIWEGVSVNVWNKQDIALVSDAVLQAAGSVPMYHLACTADESAVSALEQILRK